MNKFYEAFVKTFKRDYVRVRPLPDAPTVLVHLQPGSTRGALAGELNRSFSCDHVAYISRGLAVPRWKPKEMLGLSCDTMRQEIGAISG